MRYSFIFVLALLPSLTFAQGRASVRPVDRIAERAVTRALERSATARSLAARLESSDVIVHVESSRGLPLGISGMTRFVVGRGGVRYLRITIDSELPDRERTAILAHELQHACEVADSGANDEEELRRVFEHHGHRSGVYFETTAAIDTERNVRLELRSARTLQAEPVVKFDH